MDMHAELLEPLLDGLPAEDRVALMDSIDRARVDQLEQKLHPPRRRRRDSDGVLRPPPALETEPQSGSETSRASDTFPR